MVGVCHDLRFIRINVSPPYLPIKLYVLKTSPLELFVKAEIGQYFAPDRKMGVAKYETARVNRHVTVWAAVTFVGKMKVVVAIERIADCRSRIF